MNNHFLLKLVSDELSETLFFATGHKVIKTRSPAGISLFAGPVTLELVAHNKITVNGVKFKSSTAARQNIQIITI